MTVLLEYINLSGGHLDRFSKVFKLIGRSHVQWLIIIILSAEVTYLQCLCAKLYECIIYTINKTAYKSVLLDLSRAASCWQWPANAINVPPVAVFCEHFPVLLADTYSTKSALSTPAPSVPAWSHSLIVALSQQRCKQEDRNINLCMFTVLLCVQVYGVCAFAYMFMCTCMIHYKGNALVCNINDNNTTRQESVVV